MVRQAVRVGSGRHVCWSVRVLVTLWPTVVVIVDGNGVVRLIASCG